MPQVVEKLSAIAPDGETKIKILTAIAKEHNVNWDRKDFEEKELKPPEDLLVRNRTGKNVKKICIKKNRCYFLL